MSTNWETGFNKREVFILFRSWKGKKILSLFHLLNEIWFNAHTLENKAHWGLFGKAKHVAYIGEFVHNISHP